MRREDLPACSRLAGAQRLRRPSRPRRRWAGQADDALVDRGGAVVTATLAAALLDLLMPQIERIIDERVAERLSAYAKLPEPSEWMTTQEAALYLRLTPSAL